MFSLSLVLIVFYSHISFIFPLLSFMFIAFYILTSPIYFSSLHLSYFSVLDEFSMFMAFVTFFVLIVSYVVSHSLPFVSYRQWAFFFTLLSCFFVFTTNNIFSFYLFYELSLLPIIYIIINWGSYPERSQSAVIFFVYTSFFTFPFFFFLINLIFTLNSTHFSFISLVSPTFMCSLIVFFCFSVKLPIYGLHFWLPIAHVEAPTFGSIILAGVLLNLGGIGLYRFYPFIDWLIISYFCLSYFFFFLVIVTFICCYQSDFKRLVAYSSVSHIMPIPILYISSNVLSLNTVLILIFFHGFASPVLFMLVGIFYGIFSTRQLLLIRGVLLISPLLSFLCILAFFFTMSTPPFPSFLAEVFILLSSFYISYYFMLFFSMFLFFSLLYNLNWLTSFLFSSYSSSLITYGLSFSSFIPIITSFIVTFMFVPLFIFF